MNFFEKKGLEGASRMVVASILQKSKDAIKLIEIQDM